MTTVRSNVVKKTKQSGTNTTPSELDNNEDCTYYNNRADEEELIYQFSSEGKFDSYNPFDY